MQYKCGFIRRTKSKQSLAAVYMHVVYSAVIIAKLTSYSKCLVSASPPPWRQSTGAPSELLC